MGPLPAKQNGIFKKILKCYDYKQYKMGLKLARQILANPETANHGETLAMKGLILNCMGKKEEAYENVKKGLRNDLMSHVCWHVYGLLQRSEHKYDEAIKCYRNALKYDKDNITILRDLSLLQIQMRDLEGFRDTRYQLFMLRSAQRVSWLSFAAAYHLLEDHATASKILDEFRRTQKQQREQNNINNSHADSENAASLKKSTQAGEPIDYEQSELLLYQVMILMEAKTFKKALDFLNRNSGHICDRLAVLEYKAEILIELGRNAEAAKLIQDYLIARNQENLLYYQLLERALNLSPQDEVNRHLLYQSIQKKYPKSQIPFKISLVFVNKPDLFETIVDDYLKKFIRKCLPALFRNLKPVYNDEYQKLVAKFNQEYLEHKNKQKEGASSDLSSTNELFYMSLNSSSNEHRRNRSTLFKRYGMPDKIRLIEQLNLKYVNNLLENTSFESLPETKNSENKTNILWVYFYLAQHYDYIGNYEKALEYVKTAIEHTPTLIELLTLKGKIYKHLGEIDKAAEQVNEAQRFDTADRYLNSKCAKYLLRANKVSAAEEMCSKFTRAGVSVTENLNEMQCMWFQIETAKAHYRMKAYGMALKKCYEIDGFFSEVTEDQFDFHTYCMRKMTLRSYIKLLRMENVLRSHRFYFEAAQIAINIYLKIHDQPQSDSKENQNSNTDDNPLSANELKKIKNKERKLAAKQQQNQKNSNNKSNIEGDVEKPNPKSVQKIAKTDPQQATVGSNKQSNDALPPDTPDIGLDPSVLEHPVDPLEKAVRFLVPLKTLAQNRIDTQLLAFEVYKRKNKLLLMLQSIKRALKLEPNHHTLQKQLAEFIKIAETTRNAGNLAKPIESVLELELPKLQVALL